MTIALLSWMGLAPLVGAQSTAEQWHRWEKELRTTRDYHQILVNGVLQKDNPYRKLTIRVTYTPVSCAVPTGPWCQQFTSYGYWDGGRVFKIRASFPAGMWNYSVSCSGVSGGFDCSTGDSILNQSGTVTVNNTNTSEPDLFERGFVRRSTNSGLKYLTYGDGQAPFFWRADTAWQAASVPRIDDTIGWSTFLNDRKTRAFTAIMMGVVPDGDNTTNATTVLWDDIPQTGAPCNPTTGSWAWPKPCSRWRAEFWRKFEEKIRLANEAGFLVVIIGVMDPQGNPQGSTLYPEQNAAALFARNLAARLAGDHVIFSPSFDDRLSTTRALMDAVGNSLRDAAPRHLLTAHLAGGACICDYYDMHNTTKHPWHQLHIFHSGHAYSRNDCAALSIEDDYECAVRRARNIPDLLSPTPTNPQACTDPCTDPAPTSSTVKPNANGEAAYDHTYTRSSTQTIDSPYGVRHTGYNSALNGAFGVTLGVLGIYNWTNISTTTLDSDGSKHMKILGDQFNLNPWQMLQRRSLRIKYQPADDEQDKKMTMAATLDSNFAMIYLPDNADVRFDATFLSGFSCDPAGQWSIVWVDPKTNRSPQPADPQPGCAPLSGDPQGATFRLTRPNCGTGNGNFGDCDWVVGLRRKGTYGAPASLQTGSALLDLWPALAEDGSGWRIIGRRLDSGEPFAISEPTPDGKRVKLPAVAQEADGKFFVVWEAEDDGDLHGIFARRVDGQGRLLDHQYAVNVTRAYDQTHPWVALSPAGRSGVVTWTSYAQDGDSGGIFARLVNPAGVPFGQEIQINEYIAGRQDFSKVVMTAPDGFFVAWTSEGQDGDAEGVYARRFDERGSPLGPEFRVNTAVEGGQWLTNLEAGVDGGVFVTWTSYSPDGSELGIFGRRYDASGSPLGEEVLVVPPSSAVQ